MRDTESARPGWWDMATQVEAPLMPPPLQQPAAAPDSDGGKQELGSDGDEGLGRREFVEAPPPKVNPWIKSSGGVNGQHPAGECSNG